MKALHTGFKNLLLGCCLSAVSWPTMAASYTLGLIEWLPWGTAYVAAEKGFWQAEGITVNIRQFSDYEVENLTAFEHGKTDFMLCMLGNAVEMMNRSPERYTIIYEHDWSHGGDYFIVPPLSDVSMLKGGKLGVYSRSAPIGFFANKVLATAGLDITAVKLLEIANTADLNQVFKRGKVDAMINFDPEASKVIKEGKGKKLFSSADFPGVIPEGIAVQKSLLQEHPEDVKKFLRGWLKAVYWQSQTDNKAAFYALLQRTQFKQSHYSESELEEFSAGAQWHTNLNTIKTRNRQGVEQYIEALLAYLKTQGQVINSQQISDYVYTDWAIAEAERIFAEK